MRLAFGLAILAVLSGCEKEPAGLQSGRPDVTVTVAKYRDDYKANEVAADQTYQGKVVLVSGYVQKISSNFLGGSIVYVAEGPDDRGEAALAYFDGDQDRNVAILKKGAAIKFLCVGDGNELNTPRLKDCRVR